VLKFGGRLEFVTRTRIEGGIPDHRATPVLSNGELFRGSAKTLRCIGE
jgi:hypothetical protein